MFQKCEQFSYEWFFEIFGDFGGPKRSPPHPIPSVNVKVPFWGEKYVKKGSFSMIVYDFYGTNWKKILKWLRRVAFVTCPWARGPTTFQGVCAFYILAWSSPLFSPIWRFRGSECSLQVDTTGRDACVPAGAGVLGGSACSLVCRHCCGYVFKQRPSVV